MARSPSASRARSRRQGSRSRRSRSRDRDRARSKKDRSRSRKRSRSHSKARARSPSRSKSRRPKRRGATPERVPPTSFADYEPVAEGSGWYLYKKTGKWKYHPETGLYLHVKSDVYYVQKEGDPKSFRRIEDDDDHIIKKMKQSEEMRKAIQATEFVQFHKDDKPPPPPDGAPSQPPPPPPSHPPPVDATPPIGFPGPPQVVGPTAFTSFTSMQEPKPPQPSVDDKKCEGKVREWNVEKGFGFIAPLGQEEAESKSIFVHLWNVVGSSHSNPINLREGARVQYRLGEQDGRERALEVVMLDKAGKPLPIHAGDQRLEEKRKSYYVTADSLGVRVHTESWPGKQSELTDRYVSDQPMEELGVYFGAFDGHNGSQVSDLASKQLHKNILAHFRQKQVQPASRDEKIKAAVKEAFLQTDKEILGLAERKKFEQVGSTALIALLHGNPKLGSALRLVLAHVGDSRGVLCRAGQAVAVSDDHRPDRLEEKKRVERAGGLVLNVRGAWRIAAPANPKANSKASRREYQGVSLTRSLGDLSFKQPNFLVADPDIKVMTLSDKDLFLVLATDGVFSVLGNQELIDLASRHWDDPEAASKNIVRTAFQKGADENLTAMVIQFGWADKGAAGYVARRQALAARGVDGGSPTFKPKDKAAAEVAAVSAVDDQDIFG